MVGMTFKSKKRVWWLTGKESSCQCRRYKRWGFDPWVGKIPTRVGNGNPLQDSCLENSIDRGAWWATVYGVAKSQTWLSRVHTRPWLQCLSLSHAHTHTPLTPGSLSLSHTHIHTPLTPVSLSLSHTHTPTPLTPVSQTLLCSAESQYKLYRAGGLLLAAPSMILCTGAWNEHEIYQTKSKNEVFFQHPSTGQLGCFPQKAFYFQL